MFRLIMIVVLMIAAGYLMVMILGITQTANKRAKLKHEHDREPFTDGRR